MHKTEKYQLPQWERSDRILMEDFNQAMSNIEDGIEGAKEEAKAESAAIRADVGAGTAGKVARVASGTCQRSGTTLSMTFDFKPMAVFLTTQFSNVTTAVLIRGAAGLDYTGQNRTGTVTWRDNGFTVTIPGATDTMKMTYVAIGIPLDGE